MDQKVTQTQEPPNKQKVWLVAHSVVTYCQHDDMIGNMITKKKDTFEPLTSCFKNIDYDDIVIGYDTTYGLVTGIFKKCHSYKENKESINQYVTNDSAWFDSIVHYIEQIPPITGKYLEFRRFIKDQERNVSKPILSKEVQDFIEKSHTNLIERQKNICIELTHQKDYELIKEGFQNNSYLIEAYNKDGTRFSGRQVEKPETLSALLEFFNNRATSFVNLFVASIFGLVTLSAISQTMFSNFPQLSGFDIEYIPVGLSLGLYLAFAAGSIYTLNNYFYCADLSSKIKSGTQYPFYDDLNKVMISHIVDGVGKNVGLADFIQKKELELSQKKQKRFLHKYSLFIVLFVLVIGSLAALVYWKPITKPILLLLYANPIITAFSLIIILLLGTLIYFKKIKK